jgi:hypothetical protein
MKSKHIGALLLAVGFLAQCRSPSPAGPGTATPIIVQSGTGPGGGGGYEITNPRSFSSLFRMNGQANVISIGAAGKIPDSPTYTLRYRDDQQGTITRLRGATYKDYDCYNVPFSPERVVLMPQPYCQEVAARGGFRLDFVTQLGPTYPRWIDADGNVMVPALLYDGDDPYRQRRPEQTLIPGERIVLFSGCVPVSCTELGKCSNFIVWKFPISDWGTVDFSYVGGRSVVPLEELADYLQKAYDERDGAR